MNLDALAQAAFGERGEHGEVRLCPSIGTYVSFGDVVAHVWPRSGRSTEDVECLVRRVLSES